MGFRQGSGQAMAWAVVALWVLSTVFSAVNAIFLIILFATPAIDSSPIGGTALSAALLHFWSIAIGSFVTFRELSSFRRSEAKSHKGVPLRRIRLASVTLSYGDAVYPIIGFGLDSSNLHSQSIVGIAASRLIAVLAATWILGATSSLTSACLPLLVRNHQNATLNGVEVAQTGRLESLAETWPTVQPDVTKTHSPVSSQIARSISSLRRSLTGSRRSNPSELRAVSTDAGSRPSTASRPSSQATDVSALDSWDTSTVSLALRNAVHAHLRSKKPQLSPIPSRSVSPADALEGPFLLPSLLANGVQSASAGHLEEDPATFAPASGPSPGHTPLWPPTATYMVRPFTAHSNSSDPGTGVLTRQSSMMSIARKTSYESIVPARVPRQSVSATSLSESVSHLRLRDLATSSEEHIHPLFRASSPTPPPSASIGTIVTAATLTDATETVTELRRTESRVGSPLTQPSDWGVFSTDTATQDNVKEEGSRGDSVTAESYFTLPFRTDYTALLSRVKSQADRIDEEQE